MPRLAGIRDIVSPSPWFTDLLQPELSPRGVGEGIWSVLPPGSTGQRYDRRAAAYDRVVGNRLYNRLLWGSSPTSYAAFARRALRSADGPFLDAGCGSLVFTAEAYAESNRPILLLDQSIGMLEAARDRLVGAVGRLPARVAMLQADLLDLPFRAASFPTVLSMGMLHLFADIDPVLRALERVVTPGGQLYLTSLVSDRAIGRRYLGLLQRAGEVAEPRSHPELLSAISAAVGDPIDSFREGNMSFIVAGSGAADGGSL